MPVTSVAFALLALGQGYGLPSVPIPPTEASAALGECAPDAERYFRLSIGRSFGRCVFATLDQRDPTGAGRIRAEMVRDTRGRMRSAIVAPAALAGNAILDDGKRMSVLVDREKLVMVQDSPALTEGDPEARVGLVRKNYRLSVAPGPRAFGRATVILDARARWNGIDSRRYRLDAATGYPLRHDVVSEAGTENLFDTVALRFADRAPRGTFRPFSRGGRQVVEYASVAALKPGEARTRAGFEPAVPRELPFGFRVSTIGINDAPGWRSVVVRASDGLVKASVYEWMSNTADASLGDGQGRSVGRRGGRTVMVVSDGSTLVRARLLDAVLDTIR